MPAVAFSTSLCDGACSYPPAPAQEWSGNVFANSRGVVRQGDAFVDHGHGPRSVAKGSSTVFANSKQLARIGDPITCGANIGTGSPNVFAGG